MSYSIGNFTFETEEEYNKANAELEFINELKKKYNINDKDDAQKIIEYLEANNKTFETSIGTWFIKMLDKKGNVNLGVRKQQPSEGAKKEGSPKEQASQPAATASRNADVSASEKHMISRLEKRINLLILLVIILLVITIVQEIQLIFGNKSTSDNSAQVTIENVIDKAQEK